MLVNHLVPRRVLWYTRQMKSAKNLRVTSFLLGFYVMQSCHADGHGRTVVTPTRLSGTSRESPTQGEERNTTPFGRTRKNFWSVRAQYLAQELERELAP